MDNILFIVSYLFGIASGLLLYRYIFYLSTLSITRQNSNYFKLILDNLKKNGKFVSRVNNNVEVSIDLPSDKITLYFTIDKNEIFIFKNQSCIKSSSEYVRREIIDSIISEIKIRWDDRINNVVNMNGALLDKKTYTRIINNLSYQGNYQTYSTKNVLNLDDILDKINEVGVDRLSEEEKEYLKNIK